MFPIIKFDNLLKCNINSGAALCTCWDPTNSYLNHFEKFHAIGNLYSSGGIPYMLYNIAHSNIKTIYVTGNDRGKIRNCLTQQFMLDRYNKYTSIIKEIKFIFIEKYKLNEIDIDVSERGSIIELEDHPCKFEERTRGYHAPGYMINMGDYEEAHKAALRYIIDFGHDISGTLEINNLMVTSQPPEIRYKDLDNDYAIALLDPYKGSLSYTYGHRLIEHFKNNQILKACNKLIKNREDRQAYMPIWDGDLDDKLKSPPCMIGIHARIVNNCLDLTAFFRSHDIFNAWKQNFMALSVLHHYMCKELGIGQIGFITTVSSSAHIYKPFVAEAVKIAEWPEFELDKTNIFFEKHGDAYLAHVRNINGILIKTVESNDKRKLEAKLIPYIHNPQHGIYIGRNLEKL
jgi:thymidylate synthase